MLKHPGIRGVLILITLIVVGGVICTIFLAQPDLLHESNDGATVMTTDGPIKGTVNKDYRTFQGIPYAAPPVGDLRWSSPQPVKPWSELRNATKPGNRCPQLVSATNPTKSLGEDCLFLNVMTPQSAQHNQLKPVLVWLHGGGFVEGAGSDFDPHRLVVSGDIVVVTVNYRLGMLGFFGYPGLKGSGSFGFEDQQAALRWVQGNIKAFGGDPHNVTLAGESAGGWSVCSQLVSPSAAGLFQRAIIQSAICTRNMPANNFSPGLPALPPWEALPDLQTTGKEIAGKLGCVDPTTAITCLRRLSVSKLQPVLQLFSLPAYGSSVLPENPVKALAEGHFHQMPLISGVNHDEAMLQIATDYEKITPEHYQQLLEGTFHEQAEQVKEHYPLSAYHNSADEAWGAVITDRMWVCPTFERNRWLAQHASVYGYEFADRNAPSSLIADPRIPLAAFHGSELVYLFDFPGYKPPFSREQWHLSDQMIHYWARFVHTGNPNGSGLPPWPSFRTSENVPYVQALAAGDKGIQPINMDAEHNCSFWSTILA
ncbi:carboxylesterase/lipase family protein [Ktedonosporobacter rubrisoli]|nr:carboxylesterase family protein [Ktedonosporobacter rubrisoli]